MATVITLDAATGSTKLFIGRLTNRRPNPPETDTLTPCVLIRAIQNIMNSSDDDEDLKIAIAMSLQDQANEPVLTLKDAIELDSETEDDDETEDETQPDVPPVTAKSSLNDVQAATGGQAGNPAGREGCKPTSSLSFLDIDRKKMEQERLARKRKASISPPPPRKIAKSSPSPSIHTSKPQLSSSKSLGPSIFPRGTVKKTWAFGYPRTGDDIKLEEVLQKQDLNLAVLSSFQWDVEWLLAKLNTRSMSAWDL